MKFVFNSKFEINTRITMRACSYDNLLSILNEGFVPLLHPCIGVAGTVSYE